MGSTGTFYFYINKKLMAESVLSLKEVAVYQQDNMVLNDVSLEIRPGEFVYLIGKTGSGKSSFMKTLYARGSTHV